MSDTRDEVKMARPPERSEEERIIGSILGYHEQLQTMTQICSSLPAGSAKDKALAIIESFLDDVGNALAKQKLKS